MHIRFLRGFWALALLGLIAGCGGGVDYQTVSGKVTLDGTPLPAAKLMLVSQNAPKTGNSDPSVTGPFIGTTDDQGHFSLGPGSNAEGGVPAGSYTLTIITAWSADVSETTIAPPEKVPPPYSTGVDFEVSEGGTDAANFELKSK
jgi:hypothetical protein